MAPSASAEYRGSTARSSSASPFGRTAMHSTTRPPSQHAIAATCTMSAGIASPVWMPVPA